MYSKKIYTSFTNRKPTSWDETRYLREEGHDGASSPLSAGYTQPLTESGNGCPGARWRWKTTSKGSGGSALQGRGRKWWGMSCKLPAEFSMNRRWERTRGTEPGWRT